MCDKYILYDFEEGEILVSFDDLNQVANYVEELISDEAIDPNCVNDVLKIYKLFPATIEAKVDISVSIEVS